MNGVSSMKLDRIRRKAIKKEIEANDLKGKTVDLFFQEYTADELDRMLNVIESSGQGFQRVVAEEIHTKLRNCEKLEFDDVNKALTLFDDNYRNFLTRGNGEDEGEVDRDKN